MSETNIGRVTRINRREFPWEVRISDDRVMAFESRASAERFVRDELPKDRVAMGLPPLPAGDRRS